MLAQGHTTVLLVEDDTLAAAEINRVLSSIGCTVWHAESATDARAVLKHGQPDLIVLDLTLPDMDGLVLCTQLTSEAHEVPFMICSTASTAEVVLAFKLGAEDVVRKPYVEPELEARVEAVLRRRRRTRTPLPLPRRDLSSGLGSQVRLRVDVAHWRVTLDDRPLNLTPTEFQLLAFMAGRAGQIISRIELARGVWRDERMSNSRTIDAYVRRVSTKLADAPRQVRGEPPPRVLNIRGLGYQLVGQVQPMTHRAG